MLRLERKLLQNPCAGRQNKKFKQERNSKENTKWCKSFSGGVRYNGDSNKDGGSRKRRLREEYEKSKTLIVREEKLYV